MDQSDQELLSAARAGDRDALEALLLRYQAKVYRFGMKMCRDPEDAKDVLQETLLAMARTVRDFRGASSLSTWLYTIARSFCIKKRRRAQSARAEPFSLHAVRDVDAAEVAHPGPSPEQDLENRQVETVLAQAIADLAPMYREVFVLRELEGLTAAEVAEVLAISVEAVKSRLHRARLAIRTALTPLLGVGEAKTAPAASRRCPDVLMLFSRHLEGEISAAVCADMQRHVQHCPWCRQACASLQRTLHLCRTAPSPQVPQAIQKAVRESLHALITASA